MPPATEGDTDLGQACQLDLTSGQSESRLPLSLVSLKKWLPGGRDLLILLLLCLLPIISFSALLFSNQTLYRDDISWIHYPLSVLKSQLLRSGQVFLWNPHIQFGFPQLADQDVLALYPLNLFFLLPVKPALALSLFAVAHFVLALYTL